MNLIGLEEIVPYSNFYEYKLFLYDDEIEIGNTDKFVCDLKFIVVNLDDKFKQKGFEENIGYAIVENLNENICILKEELEEKVRIFILQEISLINMEKKSINVILSLKK